MAEHYMFQIWKNGDIGQYVEHTDDFEQAVAHFEDPSTISIDVNMGVGKQISARNIDDLEEFYQQLELMESKRNAAELDYLRGKDGTFERQRKAVELKQQEERAYIEMKKASMEVFPAPDETSTKIYCANPVKEVDNNHRLDSIMMALTSCRSCVNKVESDADACMSLDYGNLQQLHMQLDFILDQAERLKEGK